MRFLHNKKKINKTILVISDIHLGAGATYDGKINFLEDFHHDRELVEFLDYYSSGSYLNRSVELIINGDFFDFLAVPFVPYFADEFWSEDAALDKLKIILKAHPQVIKAIDRFLTKKNKSIVYIIGNHDGELVFEKVRNHFIKSLSTPARDRFSFYLEEAYIPVEGIFIKHGHEYEVAHQFHIKESVVESSEGKKYFIPPWGSYYVTRVVNKFKGERNYINQLHPIHNFIIYGLIFDTLFILRFAFAHFYYFAMVRFLYFYQSNRSFKDIYHNIIRELELFQDAEELTKSFFERNKVKALIMGHTHQAMFRTYEDGSVFVNTGTWIKMVNLDFHSNCPEINLTYCQIEISDKKNKVSDDFEHLNVSLHIWQGKQTLPYTIF